MSELDLKRRGFQVSAGDVAEDALKHRADAVLATLKLDLTSTEIPRGRFHAIYLDGVLGHLTEDAAWDDSWLRLHGSEAKCLLLSNDLSDTDDQANPGGRGESVRFLAKPDSDFC